MNKNDNRNRSLNSPVLRNILTLFTGAGLAQLITIGSTPIISRLFSPGDFGIAALLLAIAGVSAPLATLSYQTAIQLPEQESEALRLLRVNIAIAFGFAIIVACGMFLHSQLSRSDFFDQFKGWQWALPILLMLYGAETSLDSLLTRMQKYKVQAISNVSSAAVASVSRILSGIVAGSSVGGLIFGDLLARIARIASLARGASLLRSRITPVQRPASYKSLLFHYREFPLFAMPSTLLHAGNKNLPLLLFGTLFSPAVAGFYAMANRLFFRPFQLMQFSFRRVYTQHMITAIRQKRRIVPLLSKACLFTASGLAIPSLLLYFYGEPAVTFFLGEKWRDAGSFIEISAPLLVFASLAIPANGAMVALRQQHRLLMFEIMTTALVATGFLGSFVLWRDPEATLYALVGVLAVRHLSLVTFAFSISRRHDDGLLRPD